MSRLRYEAYLIAEAPFLGCLNTRRIWISSTEKTCCHPDPIGERTWVSDWVGSPSRLAERECAYPSNRSASFGRLPSITLAQSHCSRSSWNWRALSINQSMPQLIICQRLIIPWQCLPGVFLEHLRLDHRTECPHGHSRFDRDGVAAKS